MERSRQHFFNQRLIKTTRWPLNWIWDWLAWKSKQSVICDMWSVICGVVSWKWKRLTFVSREKISSSFRCLQKNTLDRELTYAVLNLSTWWQIIQILIFHQSHPMHCKKRSKIVIQTLILIFEIFSRHCLYIVAHSLEARGEGGGEASPFANGFHKHLFDWLDTLPNDITVALSYQSLI